VNPGYEDRREKERERKRGNGAGGKKMLLVRGRSQREISGIFRGGVVSVISTTPLCPAIPSYAGGNT